MTTRLLLAAREAVRTHDTLIGSTVLEPFDDDGPEWRDWRAEHAILEQVMARSLSYLNVVFDDNGMGPVTVATFRPKCQNMIAAVA